MKLIKMVYLAMIKTMIVTLILQAFAFAVHAEDERDLDESQVLLQQAMMQSNADYNMHKKKFNNDEYDRADDWADRDRQTIVIGGRNNDLKDFKEMKEEVGQDREVSSHQESSNEEKLAD